MDCSCLRELLAEDSIDSLSTERCRTWGCGGGDRNGVVVVVGASGRDVVDTSGREAARVNARRRIMFGALALPVLGQQQRCMVGCLFGGLVRKCCPLGSDMGARAACAKLSAPRASTARVPDAARHGGQLVDDDNNLAPQQRMACLQLLWSQSALLC
jgi:hypothetical protein